MIHIQHNIFFYFWACVYLMIFLSIQGHLSSAHTNLVTQGRLDIKCKLYFSGSRETPKESEQTQGNNEIITVYINIGKGKIYPQTQMMSDV